VFYMVLCTNWRRHIGVNGKEVTIHALRIHFLVLIILWWKQRFCSSHKNFAPTGLLKLTTKNNSQNWIPQSCFNWEVSAQLSKFDFCHDEQLNKTMNSIAKAALCIIHIHSIKKFEFAHHGTLIYNLFYMKSFGEFKNFGIYQSWHSTKF